MTVRIPLDVLRTCATRHRAPLSLVVATGLALALASGCGPGSEMNDAGAEPGDSGPGRVDAGHPDGGERNACGGFAVLPMTPGASCGDCENGVVLCSGADAVRCVGATAFNACGGCGALGGTVGAACGACGAGVFACGMGASLVCEGEDGANACGGCSALASEPGADCDAGGEDGLYRCAGPEAVGCVPIGANACGGLGELSASPGTPCGACDRGIVACDGTDAVTCEGESAGLNACGGCGELIGAPGASCGECGGVFACHEDGYAVCDEPARNVCGGCGALSGAPGDICDGGLLACRAGELACVAGASNACGGTVALSSAPGDLCGECGGGHLTCAGPDSLACVGDLERNACGGCGALSGVPGASCGPAGWAWTCTMDGAATCRPEDVDAIVELRVRPVRSDLELAFTLELVAEAVRADGRVDDVTEMANWSTSDSSVVSLDGQVATGEALGDATVEATFAGLTQGAMLTVIPFASLAVSPEVASVGVGGTAAFMATATSADGDTAAVTGRAVWASSTASVATVTGGVATAISEGTTEIRASLAGFTAAATLTVAPATLAGLTLTPSALAVPVGGTATLTATASYSDGSDTDVTASCAWSVVPATAASVDGAGLLTASSLGNATATCTFGGQTASSAVTVTAATLDRVELTPTSVSLEVGQSAPLTATAHYSDGTSTDVTEAASWSSSASGTADVDSGGSVTGVAEGAATITAVFSGEMGTATVTVEPPSLVGLEIDPVDPSVPVGRTTTLVARALYSDGSAEDVTAEASWSSTPTSVATVIGGVVTGVAEGVATVSAMFDGAGAAADVSVTPPPADALMLTAIGPFELGVGTRLRVRAIATYPGGRMEDVTDRAAWLSSSGSVATVTSEGWSTAVGPGTATVTAQLDGLSASYELRISAEPSRGRGSTQSPRLLATMSTNSSVGRGSAQLRLLATMSTNSSVGRGSVGLVMVDNDHD